jgi:DNA-directed RNA polymerase specialized sigma subunit
MKNENLSDQIVFYREKYKAFIDLVCSKYKMHPSDLETCKLYGLWRFVRTYDENKASIKTYIARCIRWECLRYLIPVKKDLEIRDMAIDIPENIHLDSLSDELQNLIELRYIQKFSTAEIAKKYKCSRQTIHRKLCKAKSILSVDYGV